MNPSSLAVRCQNVTTVYDTGGQKVTALNCVNLEIAMGELMMLVEPSGCGTKRWRKPLQQTSWLFN